MKKLWLALSLVFAGNALVLGSNALQGSQEERSILALNQEWKVQIGNQKYNVTIIELLGNDTVRIQYEDGKVGLALTEQIVWLQKLS